MEAELDDHGQSKARSGAGGLPSESSGAKVHVRVIARLAFAVVVLRGYDIQAEDRELKAEATCTLDFEMRILAMPVCCRCNSHTSSQTPTQPSSQTTPHPSNIPSLGSACFGSQDTQPPTQPSPDNEMAHETSDQRSVADNIGMSSLTDNNGMLGARPDFLPDFLPEQQDQQILPEIIPNDQTTPTPETVSQHPLSQPSNHGLSATPDWPSPALHPPDFCWGSYEGIHWRRMFSWCHQVRLERLLFLS